MPNSPTDARRHVVRWILAVELGQHAVGASVPAGATVPPAQVAGRQLERINFDSLDELSRGYHWKVCNTLSWGMYREPINGNSCSTSRDDV